MLRAFLHQGYSKRGKNTAIQSSQIYRQSSEISSFCMHSVAPLFFFYKDMDSLGKDSTELSPCRDLGSAEVSEEVSAPLANVCAPAPQSKPKRQSLLSSFTHD